MAGLRELLNIKGKAELEGLAGPVDGTTQAFRQTCFARNAFGSYHDFCCLEFIAPNGIGCATFELWGGGGGGAGHYTCNTNSLNGVGGTAGAYVVRCLGSGDISGGDTYCMIIGRSTTCSNAHGTRGCFTCMCGPQAELCAEGGYGGCCQFTSNNTIQCVTVQAEAYGGDYNIPGLYSALCVKCCYPDTYGWNKHFIPYPGGLQNLCGGHIMINEDACGGCYPQRREMLCKASQSLLGPGAPHVQCYGYIPGLPGQSVGLYCECECNYGCVCGDGGNPGMIRITYK